MQRPAVDEAAGIELRRGPGGIVRNSLAVHKGPGQARLDAVEDLEAAGDGDGEVVGRRAPDVAKVDGTPVEGAADDRLLIDTTVPAHVGDDEPPARLQHPRELGEDGGHVRHVAERQGTDDEVDVGIGQREVLQRRLVQLGLGKLFARDVQHRGRGVDADHPVPARGEMGGVASGAAGGVERDTGLHPVEEAAHHRLLNLDHPVAGRVVVRRPGREAILPGRADPSGPARPPGTRGRAGGAG
ncbi:hypothetical protein Afil01_43910 [Actinorhabdospora filicis]|uniref:Uncharacterized protein n=1 Tax=Actinorhabdospora filicis TaxID=1785913 RepID=A0A9W6SPD9_9ACTN|nr:hypothetical protein Afil01_43910 [Actinorhabdospora filicis]